MTEITDTRLAEITARCEAATPGPWTSERNVAVTNIKSDILFIAHTREDLPDCVAEIHRLQAELESEKRRSEAAAKDVFKAAQFPCDYCKNPDSEKCIECESDNHEYWEWRGTEAKHE